jgi:hypothetical protein
MALITNRLSLAYCRAGRPRWCLFRPAHEALVVHYQPPHRSYFGDPVVSLQRYLALLACNLSVPHSACCDQRTAMLLPGTNQLSALRRLGAPEQAMPPTVVVRIHNGLSGWLHTTAPPSLR